MNNTLPGLSAPPRDTTVADAARCAAADARLAQKREKMLRAEILRTLRKIGPTCTAQLCRCWIPAPHTSTSLRATLREMESEGLLAYSRRAGWSVR